MTYLLNLFLVTILLCGIWYHDYPFLEIHPECVPNICIILGCLTKHHGLSDLKSRSLFSHSSKSQDQDASMARFWWRRASSWLADGYLFAVSSHRGERALMSVPLLIKAPVLWDLGSTLITSLNFNLSLKTLSVIPSH